jgi:solute:Na+ symporter, SSS family
MTFTLSAIDITIMLFFPFLVIITGILAARKQDKTTEGYFLASGRLPWYVIGAAFVSTSVSSEQIVGTVGAAYEHGMGIANWEWFGLAQIPLILFFIPMYLKNRITTVPEFLERRFSPMCSTLYSWIMLLAYVIIFMTPALYGGSLALASLTGVNFYLLLWLTVLVIALYSVKGGLGSVMWADALQCLMLVGGGIILFFTALRKIPGGWSAMVAANPERFHLYRPPADDIAPFLGLICASFGVFLFYQAANQVMIQRVLGARSTWDGIMGIIFAGFINRVRPLVTCFLGFVVYHWIHEMNMAEPLADKDLVFPFALRNLSPAWGLRGVILAGFLAAVMSTVSGLSNSTATIFSLAVYKKVINPAANDTQMIRVGRITAVLALAAAAALAPLIQHLGGIFLYFQKGVTFVATPFIAVLLLGIFCRRINHQGALFGIVGGTFIALILGFGGPLIGISLHWLYLGAIAQVIIMFGIVAVSLMTVPPPDTKTRPFKWNMDMLRAISDEKMRPWWQSWILWFGILYTVIILLYWHFW